MDLQTPYAFGKKYAAAFEEMEPKVRAELAKEGFGVLTEINIKDKFKEKLDRDFRKYLILGACNPPLAWEAFGREINIGTLLPCNVVIYEDGGGCCVMVMDPVAALSLIGNPDVSALALTVKEKMHRVLAAL